MRSNNGETRFFLGGRWRLSGPAPEAGSGAKQGRECTCKARAVWLPRARGGQSQSRKTFNTCRVPEGTISDSKTRQQSDQTPRVTLLGSGAQQRRGSKLIGYAVTFTCGQSDQVTLVKMAGEQQAKFDREQQARRQSDQTPRVTLLGSGVQRIRKCRARHLGKHNDAAQGRARRMHRHTSGLKCNFFHVAGNRKRWARRPQD